MIEHDMPNGGPALATKLRSVPAELVPPYGLGDP